MSPRWTEPPRVHVSARLEAELVASVDEAAAAAGQSRSEWIRDVLAAKFEEPTGVDPRLVVQIDDLVSLADRTRTLVAELHRYATRPALIRWADELHPDRAEAVASTYEPLTPYAGTDDGMIRA